MKKASNEHTMASDNGQAPLELTLISFGYKEGAPPLANLVFDVRFLKNPFWIEELRPLTGRDSAVQDYVLEQPLATEFLQSITNMLELLLPRLAEQKITDFSVAFGCTGGQHRSATMVEALATEINQRFPQFKIHKQHRELDGDGNTVTVTTEQPGYSSSPVKPDEVRGAG